MVRVGDIVKFRTNGLIAKGWPSKKQSINSRDYFAITSGTGGKTIIALVLDVEEQLLHTTNGVFWYADDNYVQILTIDLG